jgi:hypothetical protein
MNIGKKSKLVLKILVIYGFLWFLTATWGNHDIDCDFDRFLSVGNGGSPLGGPVVPVPVVRIYEMANPHSLIDPKNQVPQTPWRYRKPGCAVAPFFIIDEIAWVRSGLGGSSERRLIFWLFGYSKSYTLKFYWEV